MRHSHGLRAAAGNGYVLGQPLEGGYFAGYISQTADSVPTHALIVAPKATGASGNGYPQTTIYAWKTTGTLTANTSSTFDGRANTDAMIAAGIANHPAAQFCVNLTIGGYTDWYLPATDELEIAYYNLKPTTATNSTGSFKGINNYSVPKRTTEYTLTVPGRTIVPAFQSGGSEAFETGALWISQENSATDAFYMPFDNGNWSFVAKTALLCRTRAFRKIAV